MEPLDAIKREQGRRGNGPFVPGDQPSTSPRISFYDGAPVSARHKELSETVVRLPRPRGGDRLPFPFSSGRVGGYDAFGLDPGFGSYVRIDP